VSRWHLVTEPAPGRPSVIAAAPHTSNWDFVLMLAIAWSVGLKFAWLGKASLFRGPAGPLMRALGGIPVDRARPAGVVDGVLARIRAGEIFSLIITPEGTRGGAKYWKSGFYRIAREAGMPVTFGYVDRRTRSVGLGPTIDLTGDVTADMEAVRAFFAGKVGVRPGTPAVPRLREETAGG
jgi:1-acyl-sn-glycerol-3-phosphate acyltransferase